MAGVWKLEGSAPWSIATVPPGSTFEGELKGEATRGAGFNYSVFETVAVEEVAADGSGEVTAYDPERGVFAGTLEIVAHPLPSTPESGMRLDFDLSWDPENARPSAAQ
jgi:hypothetical protein